MNKNEPNEIIDGKHIQLSVSQLSTSAHDNVSRSESFSARENSINASVKEHEIMAHKQQKDFETEYARQTFFKLNETKEDWFLFTLLILFIVLSLGYIGLNVKDKLKWIIYLVIAIFGACLFSLSSVFGSFGLRKPTVLFKSLTIIALSSLVFFTMSSFNAHPITNLFLLLYVLLVASFSSLPHISVIKIVFLTTLIHCIFFWNELYRYFDIVYFISVIGLGFISIWFSYIIEYKSRELFIIGLAYEKDQEEMWKELGQVLPGFAIDRMKNKQLKKKGKTKKKGNDATLILDRFNHCCVFESDLVGFTQWSSKQTPLTVVEFLNVLYTNLDAHLVECGLEKIDTIGDAYICCNFTGQTDSVLDFSLKTVQTIDEICKNLGIDIGIRIGISTGRIIGTVLGETTKRYHIFGEALDQSISLESQSNAGRILCCNETIKRSSKLYVFEDANCVIPAGWLIKKNDSFRQSLMLAN